MSISIIAAMGREREIGINGKIPWHLPEDLKHFKEITTGHPIIMGRKTFESIVNPLPNRKNIIVTRDPNFKAPEECIVVNSFQTALEIAAKNDSEVFVIGGGEIFSQALGIADKMYLTIVDIVEPNADTYFPPFNLEEWRISQTLAHSTPETVPIGYSYVVYERIGTR